MEFKKESIESEDKLLKEMTTFLYNDFNEGLLMIEKNDNQYSRRSFIRFLFSAIESVIYGMKNEILNRIDKARPTFTTGELSILEENSFNLNKNGIIVESQKYFEIKKNIRFVFQAYGKSYNTKLGLNVSDKNWKYFKELVSVRNRITHPKKINDTIITDDEIEKSHLVFKWFAQQLNDAITITTKALKDNVEELKSQVELYKK